MNVNNGECDCNEFLHEGEVVDVERTLPLLFCHGLPKGLDNFKEEELECFIPYMNECSARLESRHIWSKPLWWIPGIHYSPTFPPAIKNPQMWQREDFLKSLVRRCYRYHKAERLLRVSSDLAAEPRVALKFSQLTKNRILISNSRNNSIYWHIHFDNLMYDYRNHQQSLRNRVPEFAEVILIDSDDEECPTICLDDNEDWEGSPIEVVSHVETPSREEKGLMNSSVDLTEQAHRVRSTGRKERPGSETTPTRQPSDVNQATSNKVRQDCVHGESTASQGLQMRICDAIQEHETTPTRPPSNVNQATSNKVRQDCVHGESTASQGIQIRICDAIQEHETTPTRPPSEVNQATSNKVRQDCVHSESTASQGLQMRICDAIQEHDVNQARRCLRQERVKIKCRASTRLVRKRESSEEHMTGTSLNEPDKMENGKDCEVIDLCGVSEDDEQIRGLSDVASGKENNMVMKNKMRGNSKLMDDLIALPSKEHFFKCLGLFNPEQCSVEKCEVDVDVVKKLRRALNIGRLIKQYEISRLVNLGIISSTLNPNQRNSRRCSSSHQWERFCNTGRKNIERSMAANMRYYKMIDKKHKNKLGHLKLNFSLKFKDHILRDCCIKVKRLSSAQIKKYSVAFKNRKARHRR